MPWHQPYRWLRRYFAHDVLASHTGGRIGLRPGDATRLAARASQSVATMRAEGYDVVGDLNDLLRVVESTHPDEITTEAKLDVGIEAIATLLADMRRRTLRAEHLASILAARPTVAEDSDGAPEWMPKPASILTTAQRRLRGSQSASTIWWLTRLSVSGIRTQRWFGSSTDSPARLIS